MDTVSTDLKAQIAALAAEEDQSVIKKMETRVVPNGKQLGRFVEYIELGMQKQRDYKGQKKEPAEEVRLTFELLGKKSLRTIEFEEDGVKKSKVVSDRISLKVKRSQNEKAKFVKLFRNMTYGRENITHLAQLLNEEFVIDVHHAKKQDGTVIPTIYKDGVFGISAPFKEDAETSKREKYNVPAALGPIRLFRFHKPTRAAWDSLFIDGTREVKNDKGETVNKSKNWLQELIMSATNFKGSALEALLATEKKSVEAKTSEVPVTVADDLDDTPTAPVATKASVVEEDTNPMDDLEG